MLSRCIFGKYKNKIFYVDIRQALNSEVWHASEWYRRRYKYPDLEIVCDAEEVENVTTQSDLPLSFSREGRRYANRAVHHYRIPNPDKPVDEGEKDDTRPPSFESTGESDPMNFI